MTSNGRTDQNASSWSKDKCLTIGFAIVLFVMTLGCGCIARVTLHIMIWHIGPPMELKNNISRLSTLNGWLKPNCSNCNDTTLQTDMAIKGTWTWAIFLVIITPYVFTILKCLLQICFKSNKQQANKENAHKEKTNIEEKTNEKEMTNEEEKTNEKNMKEKTIEEEKTNEEENTNEKEKTNNEEKKTEDKKRNKEQKTNDEEKTNKEEMTNEDKKRNKEEKTNDEEKIDEREKTVEKEKTDEKHKTYEVEKAYEEENTNKEKPNENEKTNKETWTNEVETNKDETTNEEEKNEEDKTTEEEKTNEEEKIDEREKTVEKEKTNEKQKTYEAEKAYEEENTNKEKPNENEKTNKDAWTNEVETKKDETTNEEEKTNETKKINEEGNTNEDNMGNKQKSGREKTKEKKKTNEMNINGEEKSNEEEKRIEDEKTDKEKTAEKKTTEEQAFNIKTCLLMTLTEVIHTVGLCILVFFVLPLFDPILASVVNMATSFLTPYINFGSIIYRVCIRKDREWELFREISGIFGMILQIAGITMLAIYLNDGLMIGLVFIGVIMVSFKHWENFEVDKEDSSCIWQLQNPRPKETCLAYVFKVICTFITVIFIFTMRNTEIDIFERQTIDRTCQFHIPFILSAIIMICDFLCYTSTKIACTINCQKVCFVMPLLLLPLLTTGTLPVAMIYPDKLKIGSCDLLFHDWCLNSGSMYDLWLLFAAFLALYSSIICITVPIWKGSGKTGRTGGVFINPFYCGIFLELSLLKNRRRSSKYVDKYGETINEIKTYDSQTSKSKPILCVCCATMWHEEDYEMLQLLKSIMRLGKMQSENKVNTDDIFNLQAHVFFDDAFIEKEDAEDAEDAKEHPKINHYVETFIKMVKKAAEELLGENYKEDYVKKLTPYGSRLEWILPCNNKLHVHLKDTNKIRHKKRWSQVMYMSYILKYQYKQPHSKFSAENIFILALDGDVKFEPEALLSLMRRLKKSKKIGAACGRIHPMGTGPMVWYQKFEYAISHWLQKVSEHVTGCVLCTPGCFSLFRGSSILKVLDTYSGVATKPRHYLQYEQGEDRWLCTLLLKKGMKIEYTAESDAYTFVPEGFYKFYNQRRRWTPSTIANIVDLLISWREITKENNNISVLYICYHLCLFVSTLLTPGTIFMLIVGAIIVSFQWIHSLIILIFNIIPVSVFMLMCVYASKQKQLQFAAILSCIHGIVMLIGLIGVVRDAVDIGFCSIATIFILFQAGVFIISAILHPKEFFCIIPGLIYFFAIPSMSMLMFLYAIGNLHDVSWGTRDTKSEAKSFIGKSHEEMEQEKGHFCSFGKFCTCMFCSTNNYTKSDYILSILNKWKYREDDLDGNQGNTETGYRVDIEDLEFSESHREQDPEEISFVEVNGYADRESVEIDEQENKWWIQTIKSHLKPFHHVHRDPAKKRKFLQEKKIIEQKLIDMRNQVCLFVYMLNAFLITLIYSLTQVDVFTGSLSIFVDCRGNQIEIVPIAVLFIVVFGFLFLIQFICMIIDRFNTLVNIAARTPTFVNKVTP